MMNQILTCTEMKAIKIIVSDPGDEQPDTYIIKII